MANNLTGVSKRPGNKSNFNLDTTQAGIVLTNNLGSPAYYGILTCVISVRGTGWTGALTVKKRGMDGSHAGVTTIYQNGNTDTTVGAGTAISADGEYYVRADAADVILDYAHTGGSVDIDFYYRIG
jgi:hypothetical protein